MWKYVKSLLPRVLRSKKFQTAVVAVIVYVSGRLGWDVSPTDLVLVIAPLIAFIVSQGWADSGKEAARIVTNAQLAMASAQILADGGDGETRKAAADSLSPPIAG